MTCKHGRCLYKIKVARGIWMCHKCRNVIRLSPPPWALRVGDRVYWHDGVVSVITR